MFKVPLHSEYCHLFDHYILETAFRAIFFSTVSTHNHLISIQLVKAWSENLHFSLHHEPSHDLEPNYPESPPLQRGPFLLPPMFPPPSSAPLCQLLKAEDPISPVRSNHLMQPESKGEGVCPHFPFPQLTTQSWHQDKEPESPRCGLPAKGREGFGSFLL